MKVAYSYLRQQFADIEPYLRDIKRLILSEDLTLGKPVGEFEERFSKLTGIPYVLGVSSGTDALILSLKILGVGPGDEVITTPNTFIATVGAIAMTGARPVFVDNNAEHTIDVAKIEGAITKRTKALMPVHLSGTPADMPAVMKIAKRHHLRVVEDAAQAILASIDGRHVGSWGDAAGFSLHPLKNLNVWGDGGIMVTRSKELYKKFKLLRNHGLVNRDKVAFFGHNCRLDSLHAVVANRLIKEAHAITTKRIEHADCFDRAFKKLSGYITIPPRRQGFKRVYHTYVIHAQRRDALLKYLTGKGISAKIHYPVPVHLQKAARYLGYKKGDFPVCEEHCRTIITLPVHQHLTQNQMDYMIDCVYKFYEKE